MVWPILISVDVTPRISAALDAAGETSSASAARPANIGTKGIDLLPVFFGTRSGYGTASCRQPSMSGTCERSNRRCAGVAGREADRCHGGVGRIRLPRLAVVARPNVPMRRLLLLPGGFSNGILSDPGARM